jgi:glycosyltransferase involved in cell wall biosynthesis
MDPKEIVVVIPAYNEEKTIRSVVGNVKRFTSRVVVVDDGSSDQTYQKAKEAGATVLKHMVNRGQGAALKTGIDFALLIGADVIISFDADGQHLAKDIPRIIQPILDGTMDVVLGSRFLDKSSNVPRIRRLMLKLAIIFTRLSCGLELTDAHNGFRAFSRKAASTIDILQDQMAHASEITREIARHQLSYCEVPVTIQYTEDSIKKGQSAFDAWRILMDLGLRRFFKK